MTDAMKTAMTELVESGVLEVAITPNRKAALVYHSKATDADYDVVRFDNHTCTCDTFRTFLSCAHTVAANKELALLMQCDRYDNAESGETGCDPYSRF